MATPTTAPYGTWTSPITSDLIVAGSIRLGEIRLDGEDVYWLEGRPTEGGRYVVVRRSPDGSITDITPPEFNVRTRVHEYGGGAYIVHNSTVYFSNFTDQRLYRQTPGSAPEPLTPEMDYRYADAVIDPTQNRLICVREDHTGGGEAVNTIVSIPLSSPRTPERAARLWCRERTSTLLPGSVPMAQPWHGSAGITPICPGTGQSCG